MTTDFQQSYSNDAFMVQEEDEITFNCDINANPKATIIQWLIDDKPLLADENGESLCVYLYLMSCQIQLYTLIYQIIKVF